jgi:lysyl-tRNA synthetase class II
MELDIYENLHGDLVIRCNENIKYDRLKKMIINGIDKVEEFERNNKFVLIDNVLNYVSATDQEKLERIQEIIS